ncbi:hypothetical protein [Clostridium tyrobutyricum]|uniref:hypothetical protein n=1 Tax=Clostridium tyrobutyricum TaxID=1519 RepID=UPI000580B115|nr:hypothetical protein [Clostridium tyrobutyricum]
MNDNGARAIIREKLLQMKDKKGISFAFIARAAGIQRFDVAHFARDGRKIREDKFNKLKDFILNY